VVDVEPEAENVFVSLVVARVVDAEFVSVVG